MKRKVRKGTFERLVAKGLTVPQIIARTGIPKSTVQRRLRQLGLQAPNSRQKLAAGRMFGELEVVCYLHGNGRTTFYKCLCRRCGNHHTVRRTDLVGKKIKTCGCARFETGKKHPNFIGYEEIHGKYWNALKRNAAARNLEFAVTIEYGWTLFLQQQRTCRLTGLPITFRGKHDTQTASLDRIDSKHGYTVGNVQWVHRDVNWMKQEFPQDYFIQLCQRVTAYCGSGV